MGQIIADINRNAKEIIRVEVSEFKGKELINLRIWFQSNPEAPYRPTQKGVALDVSRYEDLKLAIEKVGEYLKDRSDDVVPEINSDRVTEDEESEEKEKSDE